MNTVKIFFFYRFVIQNLCVCRYFVVLKAIAFNSCSTLDDLTETKESDKSIGSSPKSKNTYLQSLGRNSLKTHKQTKSVETIDTSDLTTIESQKNQPKKY